MAMCRGTDRERSFFCFSNKAMAVSSKAKAAQGGLCWQFH